MLRILTVFLLACFAAGLPLTQNETREYYGACPTTCCCCGFLATSDRCESKNGASPPGHKWMIYIDDVVGTVYVYGYSLDIYQQPDGTISILSKVMNAFASIGDPINIIIHKSVGSRKLELNETD